MANYCDYDMHIKGQQKAVEQLISYLKCEYHYWKDCESHNKPPADKEYNFHFKRDEWNLYATANKFFCRNFGTDEYDFYWDKASGEYVSAVSGYCAWAAHLCFLNGPTSYYRGTVNEGSLFALHATCLEKETAKLGLTVEIYSTENGCQFAEHYIIEKGKFVTDEIFDYSEYLLDDFESQAQLEKEIGRPMTDEEVKDGQAVVCSGELYEWLF